MINLRHNHYPGAKFREKILKVEGEEGGILQNEDAFVFQTAFYHDSQRLCQYELTRIVELPVNGSNRLRPVLGREVAHLLNNDAAVQVLIGSRVLNALRAAGISGGHTRRTRTNFCCALLTQ